MDRRIQTAIHLIERDIRRAPSPQQLAASVQLSLSRFYDLFKRETGTVPSRYLKALRLQRHAFCDRPPARRQRRSAGRTVS